VVAGASLQLATIPGDALRALVQAQPALGLRMVAHMAELLDRLTDEHEERLLQSVAQRLLAFVVRQGRGRREIALTHEELAQHLGASRARVSRALKTLERQGQLRCRRGRIEIREAPTAAAR
jgi:CRP/FNR family transcriptional regulator